MAGIGNGQITVDVGVKLQVLQSSVNEIQKILDNLKPNSSRFKELTTILGAARKEMERLQLQTSKPFGNQSQFDKAGKSIDKIEESLDRAQLAINKISFNDLKLDSSQQAQVDAFTKQIQQAKESLTEFKELEKQNLFGNDAFKDFADSFDPNLIKKNFEQVTRAIEAETEKIDSAIAASENKIKKYDSQIQIGKNIKNFMQTGGLTKKNLGDQYEKIFTETTKGIRFKPGGQSILFDWLKEQFNLSSAQIDELTKLKTAPAIQQLFSGDKAGEFFKKQLNLANRADTNQITEKNNLTALNEAAKNAASANQVLATGVKNVSDAEKDAKDTIDKSTIGLEQLMAVILKTTTSNEGLKNSFSTSNSQLESFRQQLAQTNTQFLALQKQQATFNSIKSAIVNFMGFNQVLNITKRAVKEAMDHIKQLDTVMNGIAIVTDMTTADLWNQVDVYSEMAQRYGTSIQGAYEVSKIYYQAGYETNEVLTLMNETLKLSKISGLDYATTTDYMMTATRGFHMEVSEASKVVDVYSALAANTAVSQQELAEAMTKTASSMESVGTTFQEASAMIATMVATTRESANNIGSAMKSIASRYGELTKDPAKLMDAEGEAMSFNKVDAALKSVGISLQTTDHQFRSFTEVILELSEKWDTLDSVQQRYIATQFAGNRQQSRFLALVSNPEQIKENLEVAESSEDTGTLQALKALDSLESKLSQVQVAYQQFYTTIGAEEVWKAFLNGTKNVIDTLNNLPKLFGKIPVGAVAVIYDIISLIKTAALNGLSEIASIWIQKTQEMTSQIQAESGKNRENGTAWVDNFVSGISSGIDKIRQVAREAVDAANEEARNKSQEQTTKATSLNDGFDYLGVHSAVQRFDAALSPEDEQEASIALAKYGLSIEDARIKLEEYTSLTHETSVAVAETGEVALSSGQKFLAGAQGIAKAALSSKKLASTTSGLAMGLNTIAMLINTTSESGKRLAGTLMTVAGGLRAVGAVLQYVGSAGNMAFPWMAVITGVIGIVNGISTAVETAQERIERLEKEAEQLNNEAKQAKADYNILQRSVDKLEELKEKRYESAEAAEEYQSAVDDLASKFPEMIAGFDEAGNIILDTTDAERILAEAREKSKQATYDAAKAEMDAAKEKLNDEKEGLTNLQLGLGENNSFNAGEKRYVNFFTDGKGSLVENSLLEDFGIKQSHGLPNSLLEKGISFETFKDELYDLASKYSEDQASIWYFLWDYIDEEKETLTDVDALKNVLQNKIQSNDEGAQKYQELLNLLTDNTALETQSTEIENLFNQIKEPDFDLVANAEQLTSLSLKLEEILKDTNLDENAKAYYENLQTQLKPIIDKVKNIFTLNEAYKGNERIVISAWQEANDNNGKAWEYLEESAGLAAIVTKQIQSNIGDTDYTTAEAEQASKWKEYQAAAEQFYSNLSESDQKVFNQMIEDTANYSGTDIAKYFNITEGTDLYNAIISYYEDGINSTRERLESNLIAHHDIDFDNLDIENTDFISTYALLIHNKENEFTKNEETFLNSILSQYDSLNKQGFAKRVETFGQSGIDLFKEIQTLPSDVQKSLINSILENGLTTKEGIQKTLNSFKNDKTVTDTQVDEYLKQIISQIINNIPLAVQTATSELIEDWDDTSKDLSKALSGGLSLKETDALITKAESLGLSLDLNADFVRNGDKLILTSEAFGKYWDKLNEQTKINSEEWQGDIKEAEALLTKIQGSQGYYGIGENEKALIEAIAPDFDWDTYLTNGRLNIEGIKALQEAVKNSSESLEYYNTYAQIAAEELKRVQDWIEGNYRETEELKGIDLKELASGNIELGREEYNLRAARDNINSAYNSLISDVLSKDFENINLEDYSGLVSENKAAIEEAIKAGDYEQFIKDYAAWAGKSIEEINALIIQAIEKDTQTTTGAAAEAIGKIQWLSSEGKGFAALKDIQTLADALGISVDKILGEYNNQLDMYLVDLSNVEGIDLSEIDGFSDVVKDSINEFLKTIFDNVSKAITGKLSNTDVTVLEGQLETLGIKNLTLDFTETVDGLKLSQKSAIALYNELKKIDALQAQLTFDELAKSLESSNENYTNISTVLKRIADLHEMIANLEPGDARLQMYRDELAVAEEIARVRSSTDNKDFKFMDRSLPSGMQNPIDYWNSTGEAYKAMNAAAKSGKMEIQDFYNIVMEMNNMAAVSGQNLEFMGQTLSGKAEDAARLIEAGFGALTNVKGDGVKIALNKIGADFKTGADAMTGDFDTGIRAMAKSQIAMLDAAINMLEAIVAMEDIDVDSDGFLDLGEIFANGKDLDGGFTREVEAWLQKLETLTGGIEIDGKSFREALMSLEPDEIQKVLNELYSIDWTLGDVDVFAQIQKVLKAFYPNANITSSGKSIFDILKVPKDADKNSAEYKKWLKDSKLSAEEADDLIHTLDKGYDVSIKDSKAAQIEKLLGLTDKNKQTFESFAGNYISRDEIRLFSELGIEYNDDGTLKSAKYTASDGTVLDLTKFDSSTWQDEITKYENQILIGSHTGEKAENIDVDKNKLTEITISDGTKVNGVISGEAGVFTASYKGQSKTFDGLTAYADAQNWIKEQAEQNLYKVGETGGAITKQNEITGELEVVPAFKVVGKKTEETDAAVAEFLQLQGEDLQKYIEEHTENGKIVLPNIPVEFEEGTDGSVIQQYVDQLYGDGSFDTLPGKIAEGIKTAFTEDTSIGEAIGTGISNAFASPIGEGEEPKTIPLPELILNPSNVTIQLDEGVKPTFSTDKLPIDSVEALLSALNLTMAEGTKPTFDGMGTLTIKDAVDANGNAGTVTIGPNTESGWDVTFEPIPEQELDQDITATGKGKVTSVTWTYAPNGLLSKITEKVIIDKLPGEVESLLPAIGKVKVATVVYDCESEETTVTINDVPLDVDSAENGKGVVHFTKADITYQYDSKNNQIGGKITASIEGISGLVVEATNTNVQGKVTISDVTFTYSTDDSGSTVQEIVVSGMDDAGNTITYPLNVNFSATADKAQIFAAIQTALAEAGYGKKEATEVAAAVADAYIGVAPEYIDNPDFNAEIEGIVAEKQLNIGTTDASTILQTLYDTYNGKTVDWTVKVEESSDAEKELYSDEDRIEIARRRYSNRGLAGSLVSSGPDINSYLEKIKNVLETGGKLQDLDFENLKKIKESTSDWFTNVDTDLLDKVLILTETSGTDNSLEFNPTLTGDPQLIELLTSEGTITKEMDIDLTMTGEITENFINAINNLNPTNLAIVAFNLATMSSSLKTISSATFTNVDEMKTRWDEILEVVKSVAEAIEGLGNITIPAPSTGGNAGGDNGGNTDTSGNGGTTGITNSTTSVDTSGLDNALQTLSTNASTASEPVASIASSISGITAEYATNATNYSKAVTGTEASGADNASSYAKAVNDTGSTGVTNAQNFKAAINTLPDKSGTINRLKNALNGLSGTLGLTVKFAIESTTGATGNVIGMSGPSSWNKNLANRSFTYTRSYAKGTLMGELGPELVVSKGRYFLVGQSGPEMVDLEDDAIVFNHLQTQRLLANGHSPTYGKPITNERKATSFATGNTGVAMASASAALAELRQLRAMWQSMLDASLADLARTAGSGGGGGGGGGGSGSEDRSGFLKDLERWYNWTRRIKYLQDDINKLVKEQSILESDRVANGREIYHNLRQRIGLLEQERDTQRALADSQREYYEQQRRLFEQTGFTRFYDFNENGQLELRNDPAFARDMQRYLMQRVPGGRLVQSTEGSGNLTVELDRQGRLRLSGQRIARDENGEARRDERTGNLIYTDESRNRRAFTATSGLDFLDQLLATTRSGQSYYSIDEQFAILRAAGFSEDMLRDAQGHKIFGSVSEMSNATVEQMEQAVQAFLDKMDNWRDTFDGLNDSISEAEQAALDLETEMNNLREEITKRELDLEKQIMNAVKDRRQAEIDAVQEQRDALADASERMINGLNEQLNREQQMYQNDQNRSELERLQRQLAILQRSGGSASQIQNLQDQIRNKQQDMYFDERQQQIDAIQEASDKQIEKLDQQIDLMTRTLEYEERNGLLWNEVRDIMEQTPEKIAAYIARYSSDYRASSSLEQGRQSTETLELAQFYRESVEDQATAEKLAKKYVKKKKYTGREAELAEQAYQSGYLNSSSEDPAERRAAARLAVENELKSYWKELGEGAFKKWASSHNVTKTTNDTYKDALKNYSEAYAIGKSKNKTAGVIKNKLNKTLDKYYKVDSKGRLVLKDKNKKPKWPTFKAGGLITETGLAWLDGTPTKPEYVLNADQTKFLRQELLTSKETLSEIVHDLQEVFKDNYNTVSSISNLTTTNDGITIQRLELNMNVESLANDYDVEQAATAMFNKMTKIARKAGTQSVARR